MLSHCIESQAYAHYIYCKYNDCTLKESSLRIFNRWGEIIFESQDPLKGWDGTITTTNGASMSPDGMYTYKINFVETGFEKEFEVVGSVVLVR